MAKLYKFPKSRKTDASGREPLPAMPKAREKVSVRRVWRTAIVVVHFVAIMFWPLLKWVASFDVLYQVGRMVYYWETPGVHAGWTALLHFGGLVALTYFVEVYRPQDRS